MPDPKAKFVKDSDGNDRFDGWQEQLPPGRTILKCVACGATSGNNTAADWMVGGIAEELRAQNELLRAKLLWWNERFCCQAHAPQNLNQLKRDCESYT